MIDGPVPACCLRVPACPDLGPIAGRSYSKVSMYSSGWPSPHTEGGRDAYHTVMSPSTRELSREREVFFRALPSRAGRVLPGWVAGTLLIRVEYADNAELWRFIMRDRAVALDHGVEPAEATLAVPAALLHQLMAGREQVIAALLRNEATLVGDVRLLLAFRRFFPSAPGSGDPRLKNRQS